MDFSLPESKTSNAGIISSKNYGIQIQLQTEQLVSGKAQIRWNFIQAAYACSCVEDVGIAKETIASIQILSSNDFDATHPKNTNISLYFTTKRNTSMITITDYIRSMQEEKYSYSYNLMKVFFCKQLQL